MPVKVGMNFARAVVSNMNEVASPIVNQILQVKLTADKPKVITGIKCGYIRQSNIGGAPADAQTAISNLNIQGRVAVVAGALELDGLAPGPLLQNFNPITAAIFTDLNVSFPVLFDEGFINSWDMSLDDPIIIGPESDANIVLSQGYVYTDTGILTSSTKIGFLNVLGYYADDMLRQPSRIIFR